MVGRWDNMDWPWHKPLCLSDEVRLVALWDRFKSDLTT